MSKMSMLTRPTRTVRCRGVLQSLLAFNNKRPSSGGGGTLNRWPITITVIITRPVSTQMSRNYDPPSAGKHSITSQFAFAGVHTARSSRPGQLAFPTCSSKHQHPILGVHLPGAASQRAIQPQTRFKLQHQVCSDNQNAIIEPFF